MWCGPDAIARVTGWTRADVWLHVRWYREQHGKTFGDVPRGGTNTGELWSALNRAGFTAIPEWEGSKRVPYETFKRGRRGVYLVLQRRHFAVHDHREPWRKGPNYSPILKAWRIAKATGVIVSAKDPLWYRAAMADAPLPHKDSTALPQDRKGEEA